ncbi:MAG TPA: hypothetical protein VHZ24_06460 [Pirellulales bacterium]|jgi:hypothetical protein|nr:hypothetical protein [Pirellulales bacterium]
MTLWQYGLRITGPLDALINLALNGTIVWYFARGDVAIPLLGSPSVEAFLTPMFFLLFTLATFFGIRNGVTARRKGWAGEPLVPGVRWARWAWRRGLLLGLLAAAVFQVAIRLINHAVPQVQVSPRTMIVLQAGLSALLGYGVQVAGVVASRRVGR